MLYIRTSIGHSEGQVKKVGAGTGHSDGQVKKAKELHCQSHMLIRSHANGYKIFLVCLTHSTTALLERETS